MTELFQHIVDGISVGAIYALIALGYTMVYGVLKLINFAHGDVFMLGAMMGWYVSSRWTSEARNPSIFGVLWVTLASMAICGVVGFLIERLAYRPIRSSPRLNSLITAIGMSFLLGSTLAAAAGILFASKYPSVHPLMGLMPGLKAFVAAVLGGIGNVPGAMLGGLLLGLAEQIVSGYLSSSWRDAVAFAILILILLVKPSALLGRGEAEKA